MAERPPITATDVAYFLSCPHTYTRKLVGPWGERVESGPLDKAIMDYGLEHEARIAKGLGWPEVPAPERDWPGGHEATVDLMRQGVPGIYQGVFELPPFRGKPDLMRRVDGESRLGDFHYEPGDVKSSVRARGEQIVQVVFYGLMMEKVQGVRPKEGFIILRDGHEERFSIGDYDLVVERAIAEIEAIRSGEAELPELHLHMGCKGCRWRQVCSQDALATDDVSLVPAIPRAYRGELRRAGAGSAGALAASDPEVVASRCDLPVEWLRLAQKRAEARVNGKPIRVWESPVAGMGPARIALTWYVDLFTPSRPVVVAGWPR